MDGQVLINIDGHIEIRTVVMEEGIEGNERPLPPQTLELSERVHRAEQKRRRKETEYDKGRSRSEFSLEDGGRRQL